MEIKISALIYKGDLLALTEDEAAEYRPEFIRSWRMTCKVLTGESVMNAGRKLADARIGPGFATDAETTAVARGRFLMEELLTEWDRTDDAGQPLPKSPENIGSLPPVVLKQFRQRVEVGSFPAATELEAMKLPKPLSASISDEPA